MSVEEYLRSCRELSQLCGQNGWIDNDTLKVQIEQRDARHVVAAVDFDEVIMEGAGCVAERVRRWGKVQLHLRDGGDVSGLEVL